MKLDADFEADLRDAVVDDVEHRMIGASANLAYQFVELVHTRLEAYADRHGYDVESTIESLGTPQVDRSRGGITVTVGWESDQMSRWEFGTSEHTVRGDPLSFVWENPPQWVREEFEQARTSGGQFRSGWRVFLDRVEVSGLPESRAIRDSLHALRRVLEA